MLPILSQSVTKSSKQQPVKYPIKTPFPVSQGVHRNGRPSLVLVKSFHSSEGGVVKRQPTAANSQSIRTKIGESATPVTHSILTVRPIPHVLESEYIPKQAVISTIKLTFKQPHDFPRTVPSQSVRLIEQNVRLIEHPATPLKRYLH